MQLRFKEYDEFIVVNKGFGLRTHRVSDGQFGLIEFLSEKLNQPLFVVHRLDKETSGLMLFAKTKLAAQKLSALFEKQEVQKTYYFLTDKTIESKSLKITSHIEKKQNTFANLNLPPNSETDFDFVQNLGNFFLWKAQPKTGKPHQIRLHAELAKIPILGDHVHGGSKYFRMALFAQKIEFSLDGVQHLFEAKRRGLFAEETAFDYVSLLNECYIKRHRIYEIEEQESYRLVHDEAEQIRADIFADHLWIYDYSKNGLTDEEKDSVKSFADQKKLKLIIRHMLDRGHGVGGLESATLDSQEETNWIAAEEKVQYLLKLDSGFSAGLFLDQRENRKFVRKQALNKRVLNLFSYTSGFSVNAALGHALEVTTVDVSSKFLDWGKENFTLNGLDSQRYEFFSQDSIVFLKGAIKLGRKWDFIICDPPTFGRSKDGVWKLENDLPHLTNLMFQCLEDQGQILFTCNFEQRTREEILELFSQKIKKQKYEIVRLPMLSLDFELTDDLKNVMKGFILQKP
jgi:23S rRNA (cytosine1962-C5)-methyltransferase